MWLHNVAPIPPGLTGQVRAPKRLGESRMKFLNMTALIALAVVYVLLVGP
jgi:hypothetical protein